MLQRIPHLSSPFPAEFPDGPFFITSFVRMQRCLTYDHWQVHEAFDLAVEEIPMLHHSQLIATEYGNTQYTVFRARDVCILVPKAKPVLTVGTSDRLILIVAKHSDPAKIAKVADPFARQFQKQYDRAQMTVAALDRRARNFVR